MSNRRIASFFALAGQFLSNPIFLAAQACWLDTLAACKFGEF